MNTEFDREPIEKTPACKCGDMPGRCPGVRNCPLNEREEEDDE